MSIYSSVIGHRAMLFDERRNKAYAEAIKSRINPNSVVLDLGAGLGLHGLIAAAQGARHVYMVDPSPVIAVAAKVAAENGLAARVTCIQERIEQTDLPESVDLILSVLTGNFLLEEDLLPSLFFARDKYLKPSGILLPDCGEMWIVPVAAEEYYEKHVSCWTHGAHEIDYSSVRKFAANSLFYDGSKARKADPLTKPEVIAILDFAKASKAECSNEITFIIEQEGDCHGLVGWFRMRLGDEWLSTSPQEHALHWSQVFLPLDPPVRVRAGEQLGVRLVRPQFGDWSWICRHGGLEQKHSTFFSQVMSLEQLKCHSKEYRPTVNAHGELVRFVLDQLTGSISTKSIFERVAKQFGGRFSSREELEKLIQSIISGYGK